jgi:preprotein translocase subunit YajC
MTPQLGLAAVLQSSPAAPAQPGWLTIVPYAAIIAIFWFVLIAPQRKRQKEHAAMLSALQKGDEVVTASGLHGTVVSIDDRVVHLRIADQVKVKVDRSSIQQRVSAPESTKP